MHSWRLIEQVTRQQLIGYLKHVKHDRYFLRVAIPFFSVVKVSKALKFI